MNNDSDKVAKRIEASMKGYASKTGEKISWAKLAKEIGYTPQAPTNWKKGKISFKVIEKIAEKLGADPSWLMYGSPNEERILEVTGIGKSLLTNPHYEGFNPNFNATEVDAELSSRVDRMHEILKNNPAIETETDLLKHFEIKDINKAKAKPTDKLSGVRLVPVISFVQAGDFKEAILNAQENFVACYAENLSGNSFALEVVGESMLPDFKPGDKIIIDPDVQPNPGDFVIAQNGEHEATFKKYRPRGYASNGDVIFELTPLNPDYPILTSSDQPIRIIGTVIEHFRALRRRQH